jgi:hypothetical protein
MVPLPVSRLPWLARASLLSSSPAEGETKMARPWIRRIGRIAILVVVVAALALPLVLVVALPDVATALSTWIAEVIPPLSLPLIIVLAAEATLLLITAIWWLWWRLPKRQVAKLTLWETKARADTEDNFRKTVGQALGGAAVLIGAVAAYLQFTQQQKTATQQIIAQQQIASDQITAQMVAKGFEQLAGDKITERLGGIYALEFVMNTSDQYHQPVLEALCAFVRDSTTRQQITLMGLLQALLSAPRGGSADKANDKPPNDIQAALTVIGRRKPGIGVVNLTRAMIPGADLFLAHLYLADLRGANLNHSDLRGAHLGLANLSDADLSGANLSYADPGWLTDLSGADLSGANLFGANLDYADLSKAQNLTQWQLIQACGKPKALPPGLTLDKPCPTPKAQ